MSGEQKYRRAKILGEQKYREVGEQKKTGEQTCIKYVHVRRATSGEQIEFWESKKNGRAKPGAKRGAKVISGEQKKTRE